MSFTDLPFQPSMDPVADEYARECLRLSRAAAEDGRLVADLAYGADYWQKIDLYLPRDGAVGRLPVLLFLHGGGWTHGYKEWCGFMAPAINAFPAIFVSVSYRLIQDADFPAPIDDSIAALRWVYDYVGGYGGDPDRIFIGGHSAGGQIASLVALAPEKLVAAGLPRNAIKACFPISGTFGKEEVLVKDAAGAVQRSLPIEAPLGQVKSVTVPFYLTWGGRENANIQSWGAEMAQRLQSAGVKVAHDVFAEDDHFQIHLKTRFGDNPWTLMVQKWMGA